MNASVGSSLSLCWHDDGRFNQERDGVINDTLTNSIIVAVPVHINFFFAAGNGRNYHRLHGWWYVILMATMTLAANDGIRKR